MNLPLFSSGKRIVTRRPRVNREREVINAILKYCKAKRIIMCRVDSKAAYNVAAGRYIRGMCDKGLPDLMGVLPGGVAAWVEVKAGKDRLKDHQRGRLSDAQKMGAMAIVSHTLDDFIEQLERFQTTKEQIQFEVEG